MSCCSRHIIASQDPDFLKNLDFYGLDEADLDELDEMLEEERARYDGCSVVSVHEKVVRIRKGWKGSNGKPLTQREFAKLLDYPIVKYAEAEKTDRYGRENRNRRWRMNCWRSW